MGEPTHYAALGLAEDASEEAIRRRFRELARQAHPDANPGDPSAHERFVRINQAYQVLSDPVRRADYDLTLREQRRRQGGYGDRKAGVPPPAGRGTGREARAGPGIPTGSGRRVRTAPPASSTRVRFRTAERAYLTKRYAEARAVLEAVIHSDPQFAPAHELLGHLHEMAGRLHDAMTHYTIAAQLDPRNRRVLGKLERVHARLVRERQRAAADRSPAAERRLSPRQRLAQRAMIICGGLSIIVFALGLVSVVPGEPLGWPIVSGWTEHLVIALVFCGGAAGFMLSLAGIIRPYDEELIFPSLAQRRGTAIPIGLLLFVSGVLLFYLACGLYLMIALVQQTISLSVLVVFAATMALLGAFFLMTSAPGGEQVLFLGGNLVFPCALIGWLVGDVFRPDWS